MMLESVHRLSIITVLIILGIQCGGEVMIDQKESEEIGNNNIFPSCCDKKSEMSCINVLSSHHNSKRSHMKNRNGIATRDKSINSNVNRVSVHAIAREPEEKWHKHLRMHQGTLKKFKDIRHPSKRNDKSFEKYFEPNSVVVHTYFEPKLNQIASVKRKYQYKRKTMNRSTKSSNKSHHFSQHFIKRYRHKQSLTKTDGGRAPTGKQNSHGKSSFVSKVMNFDRNKKRQLSAKRLKYFGHQGRNNLNCIMDRSRILNSIHNQLPLVDAIFL